MMMITMNSKAELKSYLAGLSPDVLKRFKLQRALQFVPAPTRDRLPRPESGSVAYRLPPTPGLALSLGPPIQGSGFTLDTAAHILTHPAVAALPIRSLTLVAVLPTVSALSLERFRKAEVLRGLCDLEWSWGHLEPSADEGPMLEILERAPLGRLSSLWLHAPTHPDGTSRLRSDLLVRRLAELAVLPSEHLYLPAVPVSPAFAAVFKEGSWASSLRSLKLRNSPSGGAWEAWAAAYPAANQLRFLEIDRCALGDAGFRALAGGPFKSVEVLLLTANGLTDACIPELESSPLRSTVRHVDLRWNAFSPEGINALRALGNKIGASVEL
jgi:hypothetical protein